MSDILAEASSEHDQLFTSELGADDSTKFRLAVNRERNKLHARKTRQRKKARLQDLQHTVAQLVAEQRRLENIVDERLTAKLLLQLNSEQHQSIIGQDTTEIDEGSDNSFISEDISENSRASSCHLEKLPPYAISNLSVLNPVQREEIRKERNRVHAKRTRTRKKKIFTDLEYQMRNAKTKIVKLHRSLEKIALLANSNHDTDDDPITHQDDNRCYHAPPLITFHCDHPSQSYSDKHLPPMSASLSSDPYQLFAKDRGVSVHHFLRQAPIFTEPQFCSMATFAIPADSMYYQADSRTLPMSYVNSFGERYLAPLQPFPSYGMQRCHFIQSDSFGEI